MTQQIQSPHSLYLITFYIYNSHPNNITPTLVSTQLIYTYYTLKPTAANHTHNLPISTASTTPPSAATANASLHTPFTNLYPSPNIQKQKALWPTTPTTKMQQMLFTLPKSKCASYSTKQWIKSNQRLDHLWLYVIAKSSSKFSKGWCRRRCSDDKQ